MPASDSMDQLKAKIRNVPDFPKPGILFYDITTLLRDGEGFRQAIDALASPFKGQAIDAVVGMESRGFIFGAAVADRLGPRLHPGAQAGQAAVEDGQGDLRPRVRVGQPRDALRRGRAGARACWWSTTCWRPAAPPRRPSSLLRGLRRRRRRRVVPDRAGGAGRPRPAGRRAGLGGPAVLTAPAASAAGPASTLYCSAERV